MLKAIYAGFQAAQDFDWPMGVSDDSQLRLVGFVDDGVHFVHRHLILVDQLDGVNSRLGELADLGARVFHTVHTPAEQLRARVWRVLKERAGHVQRRTGEFAFADAVANVNAGL